MQLTPRTSAAPIMALIFGLLAPTDSHSTTIDFDTLLDGTPTSSLSAFVADLYISLGVSFRSLDDEGPSFTHPMHSFGKPTIGIDDTRRTLGPTTFNIITEFTRPVNHVSAEVASSASNSVTAIAYDSKGKVLGTSTSLPSAFVGERHNISFSGIGEISLVYWAATNQPHVSGVAMDNLTFVAATVPERYAVLLGLENGISDMERYLLASGWQKDKIFSYPSETHPDFDTSWLTSIPAKAGDDFLFYYNGHGGTNIIGDGGETHRSGTFDVVSFGKTYTYAFAGDEFLAGYRNWITDDELTALFGGNSGAGDPWSIVYKTFIIDSCFSGGFWGGNDSTGRGDLERLPLTRLIASSAEDKTTWAPGAFGTHYTYLTDRYLEDALLDKEADSNGDGIVTYAELAAWLANKPVLTFTNERILAEDLDYDALYSGTQQVMYFTNMPEEAENRIFVNASTSVPEPGTLVMVALGLLGICAGTVRRTNGRRCAV